MEPLRANAAREVLSNYTKWFNEQLSPERGVLLEAEDRSPWGELNAFGERDHQRHESPESERYALDKQGALEDPSIDDHADTETNPDRSELSGSQNGEPHDQVSHPPSEENPEGFQYQYEDDDDSYNIDEDEFEGEPEETDSSESVNAVETTSYHFGDKSSTAPHAAFRLRQIAPKTDVALLALRQSSFFRKPFDFPLFNHITISDDQSAGSEIAERNLLALRGRKTSPEPGVGSSYTGLIPRSEILRSDYGGLEDYQMQLMLLEQLNRKRLMMARQEPEMVAHGQDATTLAGVGLMISSSASQVTPATILKDNKTTSGVADKQDPLRAHDPSQLDLEKLQEYIELLQTQVKKLESSQKEPSPSRFQVLHRIMQNQRDHKSSTYFDNPEWIEGQHGQRQLRCSLPVTNFDLYLEKNKDIAFIVYRDFLAGSGRPDHSTEIAGSVRPLPSSETIRPITQVLIQTIETLLSSQDEFSSLLQEYKKSPELQAPYLAVYHSRKYLHTFQEGLSSEAQKQFSLLLQYTTDQYGEKYAAADSLFSENKISSDNVPYLFKPGDILVERTRGQYSAFVASSWPKMGWSEYVSRLKGNVRSGDHLPLYGSHKASKSVANEKIKVQSWSVTGWNWGFDGNFQRQSYIRHFKIEVSEETKHDAVTQENTMAELKQRIDTNQARGQNIIDLSIFPLAYAEPDLIDRLQRRGSTFWKCRNRRLVSYMEKGVNNNQTMVEERYMIDFKTYCSLHPNNVFQRSSLDELGDDAMAKDEPPDEKFSYLLPTTIKGYNLRLKKWFDLEVDRISEVKWNVEAFESLVIERKARNLILALVSNQIAAERSTDLIAGKGNGLILLLHGGPGTGKTLTAESVAEIAQKPLYRVSCGDVGTKAEDVEKYLESVLHLGKIWGCVVLLDEADVFLEQRSLEDLKRNALVSVFLRVLEYYEGILVLTSNRVGTFDEAFKSRIQLALHYPNLGQYQRLRVWENFIKRLESFDDDKVETQEIRDHLEDLSKEKMNGRQIRNAITTARQYAEWQSEQSKDGATKKMTYEHLKDVIEVASRFDKYLDKLHGGFSADQLAEDEGLRLSKGGD
ncbi:hypothetical protein GJ744_011888 [Endocarpon pusillum]|uniref:AAA+ ATPase domain-containing protein n=1 Tax=Endocarpon pusillum TaxID=364733 RepID=A0A8H7AJK5_9EURO|nr:hypothetical protein GJ744_011888 [Endocarpon pusillum]